MKKFLSKILSAALLVALTANFIACGKTEEPKEKKIMTLSLNPEVEFVLDEEGNVASANALNEEGNLILSAEVFVGKSAEDAASLFVQVSRDMGFIIAGDAEIADNHISIAISGDPKEGEELYKDVKKEIEDYLLEEDIAAAIVQTELTKMQLEALAMQCAPYIEDAEIIALEQMELIELIYASRQETAEFYSQELKNAYYEAKAFAMECAKLDVLKSQVQGAAKLALDISYGLYEKTIETIEYTRKIHLVDESSLYQIALANFRETKILYLKYREEVALMEQTAKTEAIFAKLNQYEAAVKAAEQNLLQAGEKANAMLDSFKETVTEQHTAVVEMITDASIQMNNHLDAISAKRIEAQNAFFNDFEVSYASAITAAKTDWANMKAELEDKTATAE